MLGTIGVGVLCLIAQTARQSGLRQQSGEPDIVFQLEQQWAGADRLMPLTTSMDPAVRHYALRAVGRLRDPRVVPQLLAETADDGASLPDIAAAIVSSLRGFDPRSDPELIAHVADWLYRLADVSDPSKASPYLMPMSRMAYTTADQVQRAETVLLHVLNETDETKGAPLPTVYRQAVDAMGWLARENGKNGQLDQTTVRFLDSMVAGAHVNDTLPGVRFSALTALVNGAEIDRDTERAALKDSDEDVRRTALKVLSGSGGGLANAERRSLALDAMNDVSAFVRYEALGAYVKHGGGAVDCRPILDLFNDQDSHVVLAAIDAMGTACKDNADATDRVAAEVTTPPAQRAWNRPAHAFVALAARAPDRAAPLMSAFSSHPLWWVRMYAARAAASMRDELTLEKLAFDANDNVREATLKPLRRLSSPQADRAIVAALGWPDDELLRTAALLLKDSPPDANVATALVAALMRVTADRKDTSRDARLALLEAIAVHGDATVGTAILPLAKDFDPEVAASAASISSRLTGQTVAAAPAVVTHGWRRQFQNLQQCVRVDLSSGGRFVMQMLPDGAAVTVDRFLTLAAVNHYYDGLTFHRVVPNFVVQGGSPDANEYSGAKDFMRDEIALGNARGTVGLSTRGLNTGDAQFYINLVDNRRLDDDYTVFAQVRSGMDAVDQIEEGVQIVRVSQASCGK